LRVTVLDDRSLRLHYVRGGAPSLDRGWVFDARGFTGPTSIAVDQSAAKLSVTTAALAVEASGAACSLAIRDRAGTVLWEEAAPHRVEASGAASLGRKLDDGEHIYGLGEKTGASDRRGRSFEMWNSDPAWSDPMGQYRTVSDPIYQSHPFLLSLRQGGRATGTFLANTHRTGFDVGKTSSDVLAMFSNVTRGSWVVRFWRRFGRLAITNRAGPTRPLRVSRRSLQNFDGDPFPPTASGSTSTTWTGFATSPGMRALLPIPPAC
jgi:hypothetical protein